MIVSGETGSGKTTQLPKIAMMVGRGQKGLIGHTQPRRIAATSIAKRISEEMGAEVGQVAGYKIRFKDELEPGATIKLMTDGILLAETQRDRLLKAYDTIIIDEAHERSLNIDFLLGYLREILTPNARTLNSLLRPRRLTRSDLPNILRTSIRSPFRLLMSRAVSIRSKFVIVRSKTKKKMTTAR